MPSDSPSSDGLQDEIARAGTLIRPVHDFPKPGILFRDVTPLLADPAAMRAVTRGLALPWRGKVDAVVGMESRGFIFGSLLAAELDLGFIPVRKPGKLPFKTESVSYGLEYGTDQLEIHVDAIADKARVLICDDLIATGGTAAATAQLVKRVGGVVAGYSFVIELGDLNGREKIPGAPVEVLFPL
jgi:adenine phosphoribosyltransferase